MRFLLMAYTLGLITSAFLFSSLSDLKGRKTVLLSTLICSQIIVIILYCCPYPVYWALILILYLAGVIMFLIFSIACIYLVELVTTKN